MERNKENERKTYTVKELAVVLGISLANAYNLVKTEGFPRLMIGNKILIPREALDRWINREVEKQSVYNT